jgi:hypothetical protein
MKTFGRTTSAALGALMISVGLSVVPAHADYTLTLTQEVIGGVPDVVANGTGSIDLTDLSLDPASPVSPLSNMTPNSAFVVTGKHEAEGAWESIGSKPVNFGSGGTTFASTASTDTFGDSVGVLNGDVVVPVGYVSGHSLSGTATYLDATFTSLGVTPGTYTWTWGSGAHADSFTLEVVPGPIVGAGLPGIAAARSFALFLLSERRQI